jgi:hypothetical protein
MAFRGRRGGHGATQEAASPGEKTEILTLRKGVLILPGRVSRRDAAINAGRLTISVPLDRTGAGSRQLDG